MALFDKLSQRGLARIGRGNNNQTSVLGVSTPKPIPVVSDIINKQTVNPAMTVPTAPILSPKSLTTTPISERLGQLPQRGQLAQSFQGGKIQKRFIADLPANVQLQGIQSILSGQETTNEGLNNFVKTLAAQGKMPEEIRLAFIEQQKASPDPLVIM